jgi:hypothetical protein
MPSPASTGTSTGDNADPDIKVAGTREALLDDSSASAIIHAVLSEFLQGKGCFPRPPRYDPENETAGVWVPSPGTTCTIGSQGKNWNRGRISLPESRVRKQSIGKVDGNLRGAGTCLLIAYKRGDLAGFFCYPEFGTRCLRSMFRPVLRDSSEQKGLFSGW